MTRNMEPLSAWTYPEAFGILASRLRQQLRQLGQKMAGLRNPRLYSFPPGHANRTLEQS